MSIGQFLQYLIIGVAVLAVYSQYKLRNKILCTFRRPNKTKVEKLIPSRTRYLIFEKGWYRVNTRKITLMWYDREINKFFPTWVPSLDFSWDSEEPLDPDDFHDTWKTPEAQYASRQTQEENIKSVGKSIASQGKAKEGLFQKYLPYIAIGAIVILLWFGWQQQNASKQIIQQQQIQMQLEQVK